MLDCLNGGSAIYSNFLKIEEGKNNWIEYWAVIQDHCICLYSDKCSEDSGEEAIKTIDLSSDTRCELAKRKTYDYRFKVHIDGATTVRMKCSSALHRQLWISHIAKASATCEDRVIALSASFNGTAQAKAPSSGRHARSLSAESQQSESQDRVIALSASFNHTAQAKSPSSGRHTRSLSAGSQQSADSDLETRDIELTDGRNSPSTPTRRGSKGLLRRLSIKKEGFMSRRNSKSSLRDNSPASDVSLPNSPASPKAYGLQSPRPSLDHNKVFVNPAFVPSPNTSPKLATKQEERTEQVDLIDMSEF